MAQHFSVKIQEWSYDSDGSAIQPVRPSCALREGNFDTWLSHISRILMPLGWQDEDETWPRPDLETKDERLAYSKLQDTWAVNTMLMFIEPAFLASQHLPRPLTSAELIAKLKQASRQLRLMDLPRELRDVIFDHCLVDPPVLVPIDSAEAWIYPEEQGYLRWGDIIVTFPEPKYALRIFEDKVDTSGSMHPLLNVSHQVREECDELHWGGNDWEIHLSCKRLHPADSALGESEPWLGPDTTLDTPRNCLKTWVDKIGLSRLRNLKRLTAIVGHVLQAILQHEGEPRPPAIQWRQSMGI